MARLGEDGRPKIPLDQLIEGQLQAAIEAIPEAERTKTLRAAVQRLQEDRAGQRDRVRAFYASFEQEAV